MKKKETLRTYLRALHKMQKHIVLVYHPDNDSTWGDRAVYLGERYSLTKEYNHRSMLQDEVVIEFDDDDRTRNKKYAETISQRLSSDRINHSIWYSGGKSYHIHFFIDLDNVANRRLFKRCVLRHYSEDLPLPDLQLCSDNHLIRAEFGVHEGSGKTKQLISKSAGYPKYSKAPQTIWDTYTSEFQRVLNRKLTMDLSEVAESKEVAFLLSTEEFRQLKDGKKRALFILINVLKPKYPDDKEGLTKFLQDWYKYCGGTSLSSKNVADLVSYHWARTTYSINEGYIREFLEELGFDTNKLHKD